MFIVVAAWHVEDSLALLGLPPLSARPRFHWFPACHTSTKWLKGKIVCLGKIQLRPFSLSLYVVMHVFAFSVWNGYPILARTRKIKASENAACFFIQCKIKGSRGRGANESSKIKQEPCTFMFFVLATGSRSSHPGSCKFDTLRKWHMEAATIKSIKWSPLAGNYRLAGRGFYHLI